MSTDHDRFRFSATCRTKDAAVLACLRSLNYYVMEGVAKRQIGHGGTGWNECRAAGYQATFRFTQPGHRQQFITEANRLLAGHWELVSTDDNDPATPQRSS